MSDKEMTFEEMMMQRIQRSILDQIGKSEYLKFDYNQRQIVPLAFVEKMWASVDWNAIIEEVKPQLQTRICNAIIGNMETEIKTDVKNLMSVSGVREKLRIEVYPKLMAVLNSEK